MNMTNKALAAEIGKISKFFFTYNNNPEYMYDPYEILCEAERRLISKASDTKDFLKAELIRLDQKAEEAETTCEHIDICGAMCSVAQTLCTLERFSPSEVNEVSDNE